MSQTLPAEETARRWGARVRAEQHAASAPLIAVGCAVLVEATLKVFLLPAAVFWEPPFWAMSRPLSGILPVVTVAVLWGVMRMARARSGLGMGRQGYGGVVLVILAVVVMVPIASYFLGPLLLMGLGLVALGWRGRERLLWVTGLALAALSPWANLGTFENRARFLGPAPTPLVLTVTGLVVIGLGVHRLRAERRTLAENPTP